MRQMIFVLLLAGVPAANACMCSGPGSPDDPQSWVSTSADVIFVGEVVALVESSRTERQGRQVFRFRPLKLLKGKPSGFIEIQVSAGYSSCDSGLMPFKVGERYLMSGNLWVDQKVDAKLTRYFMGLCSLHELVDPKTLKPLAPPPGIRPHPEWTRP